MSADQMPTKPLTPMMAQYWALKNKHEDKFLFFRLGDFYELFENDAINGSKIMAIALTHRHGIPMCGVPHHQLMHYAKRLLQAGHKIAIVEQTETPSADTKLLRREITQIITPSSLTEISVLNEENNNFLLTLEIIAPHSNRKKTTFYLSHCLLDISTGESILQKKLLRQEGNDIFQLSSHLADVISWANPSEILLLCRHLKNPERNKNPLPSQTLQQPKTQSLFKQTINHANSKKTTPKEIDFFPLSTLHLKKDKNEKDKNYSKILETILVKLLTLNYQKKLPTGIQYSQLFTNNLTNTSSVVEQLKDWKNCFANSQHFTNTVKKLSDAHQCSTFFAALSYMQNNTGHTVSNLNTPQIKDSQHFSLLDETSLQHLEIFDGETSNNENGKPLTLFNHLNNCNTAMGSRKLRRELGFSTKNLAAIEARLSRVEWLLKHPHSLLTLRKTLNKIRDIERLTTLINFKRASANQLLSLATTLQATAEIFSFLAELEKDGCWMCYALKNLAAQHSVFDITPNEKNGKDSFYINNINNINNNYKSENATGSFLSNKNASTLQDISNKITNLTSLIHKTFAQQEENEKTIDRNNNNAFANITTASPTITATTDEKLQELKNKKDLLLDQILDFFQKQQPQLPPKARLRYTDAAGYFIEINKNLSSAMPTHYIRKQTLTREERFTTEELTILESAIKTAQQNYSQREKECFLELLSKISAQQYFIKSLSNFISELDVECALAFIATNQNYVRPIMIKNGTLKVNDMRHPIIEAQLIKTAHAFTSNNLSIGDNNHIHIITGPNMSGKSTYLRQTALLTVMAHLGSFVAANKAVIPITSRIFTRVGAKDRLARGESTFLVEMKETANILQNADNHSLIIMDEIGRGTSTYDGLSIAWGIVSYLANNSKIKTLFATHFHELTLLGRNHDNYPLKSNIENEENNTNTTKKNNGLAGVKNFHIAVENSAGKIVFLKKVRPGVAGKSYGIHVAQMAGLPHTVLQIAKQHLAILEETQSKNNKKKLTKHLSTPSSLPKLSYQQQQTEKKKNEMWEILQNIILEDTTPLQALTYLNKLQSLQKQL